ncbi:MAG: hypothetical protein KatS3mg031_3115 [Chitinophagales bacterium]|nr:MAG: hypothetical protein KatS3mg031_3115 [Chitinophagales bacterium]
MRQKLKKVFYRLFHSPTFTTWGNFLVKLGGWAFLLPLILHESPEEEVSIWMTFQTMIDFLLIFDLGLMQSFSRAFSYAFAGVRRLDVDKHGKLLPAEHGAVNWDLMGKIYGVSRRIYMFLAIAAVVLVLLYSAFVFYPELKGLESFDAYRYEMLWALLFLILGGGARLFGNLYISTLTGTNHIALLNRWEILFGSLGLLSAIITYLLTRNIYWVIVVQCTWYVLTVVRNAFLVRSKLPHLKIMPFDKNIFNVVWQAVWRSGIGLLAGTGLVRASALMLVKFVPLAQAGAYQLAVKLIGTISDFSRAPFYSRLPEMTILYARNQWRELTQIAYRGIWMSLLVFASATVAVGFLHEWVLQLLQSEAGFVSNTVWFLLVLAYGIERYGAMHLQLYSLSNHILWHIANGVAGIIHLCSLFITFPLLGLTAFPLSLLLGNIFYVGYSASLVYRHLPIRPQDINKKALWGIILSWLLALFLFLLMF